MGEGGKKEGREEKGRSVLEGRKKYIYLAHAAQKTKNQIRFQTHIFE